MARHTLIRLTECAWLLTPDGTTDRPLLGVVSGERGTLVIDAGNSPAHAAELAAALAGAGLPRPAWLALTHWHWDHVFGAAAFDAPLIAHGLTQRMLATMRGWAWDDAALDERVADGVEIAFCRDMIKAELPDRSGLRLRAADLIFERELTVDLGGTTCRIIHVGGDHAEDSAIVHVPEERVAFLGDALYPAIYREPRHYTLPLIRPLLERIVALDADWYLWGHDPEPMPRAAMQRFAERLLMIGETVAAEAGDREASIRSLGLRLGQPPGADDLDDLDAFRHGLRADQPAAGAERLP